ncbi:unnamed protein product [Brassica oleracea var. botrytis]
MDMHPPEDIYSRCNTRLWRSLTSYQASSSPDLTLKLSISNPPLVSCVTMGMALLLVWLVSSTSFSVL